MPKIFKDTSPSSNNVNLRNHSRRYISFRTTLTDKRGADIFVGNVSDASKNIYVADIITDFSNGTDKIELEDKTFSDLTITQISSGSFSGDVQIKDTSSKKILFLLDDRDVSLIDADDFIVTDLI